MKHPIFLFVGLFTSLICLGQPAMKAIDSLKNKTLNLERSSKELRNLNDSLNKELYFFRAEEDFYVMAVERQGTHFEWLIAVVIAIGGFISWRFYENDIDKIKSNFKDSENKITDLLSSTQKKFKIYNTICIAKFPKFL